MRARAREETPAGEVACLGKVLLGSRDRERREWAADALADRGMVSAYAYLRHALWDPAESVRERAVNAVAALGARQSGPELALLYAWSGPRLRRVILRAARRLGSGCGFDSILRLAQDDPDSKVRALASRRRRAGAAAPRRF